MSRKASIYSVGITALLFGSIGSAFAMNSLDIIYVDGQPCGEFCQSWIGIRGQYPQSRVRFGRPRLSESDGNGPLSTSGRLYREAPARNLRSRATAKSARKSSPMPGHGEAGLAFSRLMGAESRLKQHQTPGVDAREEKRPFMATEGSTESQQHRESNSKTASIEHSISMAQDTTQPDMKPKPLVEKPISQNESPNTKESPSLADTSTHPIVASHEKELGPAETASTSIPPTVEAIRENTDPASAPATPDKNEQRPSAELEPSQLVRQAETKSPVPDSDPPQMRPEAGAEANTASTEPGSQRAVPDRIEANPAVANPVLTDPKSKLAEGGQAQMPDRDQQVAAISIPGTSKPTLPSSVNVDHRVAIVLTRLNIEAIADLASKTVAIDTKQRVSLDSVRGAFRAAGAGDVQLTNGGVKALDRLMAGEVSGAVLALVSSTAADSFPDIAGFKLYRVPLSVN